MIVSRNAVSNVQSGHGLLRSVSGNPIPETILEPYDAGRVHKAHLVSASSEVENDNLSDNDVCGPPYSLSRADSDASWPAGHDKQRRDLASFQRMSTTSTAVSQSAVPFSVSSTELSAASVLSKVTQEHCIRRITSRNREGNSSLEKRLSSHVAQQKETSSWRVEPHSTRYSCRHPPISDQATASPRGIDNPVVVAPQANYVHRVKEIEKGAKWLSSSLLSLLRSNGIPEDTIIDADEITFNSVLVPKTTSRNSGWLHKDNILYFGQDWTLDRVNSGTFCSVFKGGYRDTTVAIKCPQQHHLQMDPSMTGFRALKEWGILCRAAGHPNILKVHGGIIHSPSEIWLVTEYVEGGDLYGRLYQPGGQYLSARDRVTIMLQIASAVSYLHGLEPKIVHKDLKANNILVSYDCMIRLCDFGDAEELDTHEGHLRWYTAVTWQYASPEVIMSNEPSRPEGLANEKVDIWSLGCIFLELCNQKTPFCHLLETLSPWLHHKALRDHIALITRGHRWSEAGFKFRTNLPYFLRSLIDSCLVFNPAGRIAAAEVVQYIEKYCYRLVEELRSLDIQ